VPTEPVGDCIVWQGALDRDGYGLVSVNDHTRRAHRVAYDREVGPIPPRLTIDHLCRNRACVNVEHMEPVTVRENVLRGFGPPGMNARKTHCSKGHAFTEANTYLYRGSRHCRPCNNEATREYRARRKERAA